MKLLYTLSIFCALVLNFTFGQTEKQKIIDRTFVELSIIQSIEIDGYIYSIGHHTANEEYYGALIKQDLDLNVIWFKYAYRGFFIPDKFQATSHMIETQDGNLIIAGANGSIFDASTWIMKVDVNGNILWEKDLDAFAFHEGAFTIPNNGDGALIVSREPPGGPNNVTFVNVDIAGDSLWTRRAQSQSGLSVASREGYLKQDGNFVHFIHEGGKAGHLEIDANGNLINYKEYVELGTSRYLQVNAVYYEPGAAYIAGRMSGSSAAIMKIDDNFNILWAKEYPELTAFTGIQKVSNGEFIANGINTSGVYNNLATSVRLDANCDPILGYAYGQIPGYHTIPFHVIELNDKYLFSGFRVEQGWNSGYQIITDLNLNSNSCYQRNFPVSVVSVDLISNFVDIDFYSYRNEINSYGTPSESSGFYQTSYSEFEINSIITSNFEVTGDDCGGQCNGTAEASTIGGNSPYSYEWSNGQTGSVATDLCAGDEVILLTGDQLGCFIYDTINIEIETPVTELCLITVDSSSAKNEIVWTKPVSNTIDGFTIYRESGSSYSAVGYVPYNDLSKFIDNTNGVNPNITSYRYKLSTIDTCGYESELSEYHETIHLTVNQGTGGQANLIWDNYEGLVYSYNRIWKDSLGDDNWVLKDSVSGNIFTWSDPDLPGPNSDYRIEVLSPYTCTSTKAIDHNSTRSNKSTIAGGQSTSGINDHDLVYYQVFPNPFSEFINLRLNHHSEAILKIFNVQGQEIKNYLINDNASIIELSDLENGVYLIHLELDSQVFKQQLIKR